MEIEIIGVGLPAVEIGSTATISMDVEKPDGDYPPDYSGETQVIPSAVSETVLPTGNRIVRENITVKKIPFAETSNIAGGYTAVIAS